MGRTVVDDYFGRINEGGAVASKGFSYQDMCAIGFLFDFIENDKFISLTVEQVNDFTILFKDEELVCQVKDYQIPKREIIEIQKKFREEEKYKYAIISPTFVKEMTSLQQKKREYFQARKAGRGAVQCAAIKQQLEEKASNLGLNTNAFWKCEFVSKALDEQEEVVLCKIFKWRELSKYDFDENILLERLQVYVARQRNKRGSITRNDVINLVEDSRVVKRPRKFECSMLSHKEAILAGLNRLAEENRSLEKEIKIIIAYIKNDEYDDAIREVVNVSRDNSIDMRMYHAWLALMVDDIKDTKRICDSVLKDGKKSNYATAFFYKGIVEYKKKKYIKAYKYMKQSESLSNDLCYEQMMCLAKLEIKLKKDLQIARNRLESCLDLKDDDWEAYYFLACLSCAKDAIKLLKTATTYTEQSEPRILLAELYRIMEDDELAYDEYKVIFSDLHKIENWRLLQGMVYCLINLGRLDEAETHLMTCLKRFIDSKENTVKDHKTVVIFDLTMNDIKLLTCTKENSYYKFSSPIGDYWIPVKSGHSMKFKDAVGVMRPPSFGGLEINREQGGLSAKSLKTATPFFAANYDDDFSLLKKMGVLIKEGIALLYSDSYEKVMPDTISKLFVGLEIGDDIRWQTYNINKADVHIKIYEYMDWITVRCFYRNVLEQTSIFSKGKGYFEFKKELETKEGYISWFYFSTHRKQLFELNIPKECVEIECC